MVIRTFGIEEELFLVDPTTRRAVPRSASVLAGLHHTRAPGSTDEDNNGDALEQELFLHQIETRTEPVSGPREALEQVVSARNVAKDAATRAGVAVIATGTAPLPPEHQQISPTDRYHAMLDTFSDIATSGDTCGMHVHVSISSEEEGVAVIDRIAPWLPVVLAISANSPFRAGHDTGHASWRAQQWTRWPSAGTTQQFGSLETYREVCRHMIASGAARDHGMIYFHARLATSYPTVEIRVSDVCADPEDAVMIATIVRALVDWAGQEWQAQRPAATYRPELLRAEHWRAARFGLADRLVDPLLHALRPARVVLETLIAHVRPMLESSGDLALVMDGTERVLRAGGAVRQRAAFEREGSLMAVVDDLVARTTTS